MRWFGGGAAEVEVNSSVRALSVRCAWTGWFGKSPLLYKLCAAAEADLLLYGIGRRHES